MPAVNTAKQTPLSGKKKQQDKALPQASQESATDKSIWGNTHFRQQVLHSLPSGLTEVCLLVEGIRCNGCVLSIERKLMGMTGVKLVQVNAMTRRARIVFDEDKTKLPELIEQLELSGYKAHPLNSKNLIDTRRDESHDLLKRLLVAGFGMMQAMMFALVIYLGPSNEVQGATLDLFRWLGFLVATPVVLYSGQIFFKGAWQGFKNKQLNMEIPIAIAIAVVYGASLYQAFQDGSEVYFDSISMLIFFLLTGRFIEMKARHRSVDNIDALARLTPSVAQRRKNDGSFENISIEQVQIDDILFVAEGEHIPADGILISEQAQVDESLLSGEAQTQFKQRDDNLIAGSLLTGAGIDFRVTECGENTFLSTLSQLANRAQTQRPQLALAGQAAVSRFVRYVLGFALVTSIAWLIIEPSQALQASLAVLVVACPCAFALAVPAAITRSLSVLSQQGVLVVNADAVEKLSLIDYVIFDKTGTLTLPSVRLHRLDPHWSEGRAKQIAASLSQHSSHPLSKALSEQYSAQLLNISDVLVKNGLGLQATLDGHTYRLGRPDFALDENNNDSAELILTENGKLVAAFKVEEQVRDDAELLIQTLQEQGIHCEILSGDAAEPVNNIASQLGITDFLARQLPSNKLERIQALQAKGHRVLVVGDGSNDAPVLAGADISIAMSTGTDLAQAQADIVLCSPHLSAIHKARSLALETMHILKQNQNWALSYNLLAVPFAAMGFVPPWLAAIGMSTSSLVVVLNAMRIGRSKRAQQNMPQTLASLETA